MRKEDNTPELRFPGFEGEWELKKLVQLTKKISDGYHGTPTYDDEGEYHFINGNNLENDMIVFNPGTKKVDKGQYEIHKRPLGSRTILMSINGTIGSLAFYNNENVVLGKSVCYIDLLETENKEFVFYQFKTSKINDFFVSELTGTTIKNLSLATIKNTEIFLPTVPEQQKIASFLTSVDEKLMQLKKQKALLEQYKKGVMQKIFSQEIRFKDENGMEFPEWKYERLGKVSNINPKSNKLPSTFIYIDLESVVTGQLLKEERIELVAAPSRAQRFLNRGDILFQMVRPYQKNNYYFDKEGAYVASTGYAQIRTTNNAKFIFHQLHLQKFVDQVIERCTGTSYPAINSTDLSNIFICLPVIAEQTKIANFLSALDDKINLCSIQIEKTEQWKEGLLQKMFC